MCFSLSLINVRKKVSANSSTSFQSLKKAPFKTNVSRCLWFICQALTIRLSFCVGEIWKGLKKIYEWQQKSDSSFSISITFGQYLVMIIFKFRLIYEKLLPNWIGQKKTHTHKLQAFITTIRLFLQHSEGMFILDGHFTIRRYERQQMFW